MNPKFFGDISPSTTFESTQGAAFEPVDPFSETKIDSSPELDFSSEDSDSFYGNNDYIQSQESELMSLWSKTIDSIFGKSDEYSESSYQDYDRFLQIDLP